MSIRVHITTAGLDKLGARMNNAANFLGRNGVRNVLRDAGALWVRAAKATIDSFAPGSVADLAASTKIQKQAEVGFIYPILRRTSEMYNSMGVTVLAPAGGNGWQIRLDMRGMRREGISNKTLAMLHATGSGNLPARDFFKRPAGFSRIIFDAVRSALRIRGRNPET